MILYVYVRTIRRRCLSVVRPKWNVMAIVTGGCGPPGPSFPGRMRRKGNNDSCTLAGSLPCRCSGRNEDLHRRLVVVDFLFPSTHFPVSFLPVLGRFLFLPYRKQALVLFPEVPKQPKYHTIIIVYLNLRKTHYTSFHRTPPSSKDSIKQRKRIFIVDSSSWIFFFLLRISQYVFYDSKQAFVTRQLSSIGSPKFPNERCS